MAMSTHGFGHAWSTSYVSGSVGGSGATVIHVLLGSLVPPAHMQFPSWQGCVGSPLNPLALPFHDFLLNLEAQLLPPTLIRRYSNLQRWEYFFTDVLPCPVIVNAAGFYPLPNFGFDPFGSKLGLFSGQSLADKISTRTGKRAGMEADTEAADPAVLA